MIATEVARRFAVALIVSVIALPNVARAEKPEDPFAEDRRPPEPEEVGTVAGQLRMLGLVGVGGRGGLSVILAGTLEQMTFPHMGVRFSGPSTIYREEGAPRTLGFKTGPSFHFIPYSPIDVGFFVEGGLAVVEPFTKEVAVAPDLTGGVTFDIHFHSFFFFRLEGQANWNRLNGTAGSTDLVRFYGFLGFGQAL